MKNYKVLYIVSFVLMLSGFTFFLGPKLVDFLNLLNGRMTDYVLAFLISYSGIALFALLKIRERRQLKLAKSNKVFFIYAPEDKDKVRDVSKALLNLGFDVWFDEISLLPGQVIEKEMDFAIKNSAAAILFISKSGIDESSLSEVSTFLKYKNVNDERFIPIIPILIEEAPIPEKLKNVMYVRYEDENLMNKLQRSLQLILGK